MTIYGGRDHLDGHGGRISRWRGAVGVLAASGIVAAAGCSPSGNSGVSPSGSSGSSETAGTTVSSSTVTAMSSMKSAVTVTSALPSSVADQLDVAINQTMSTANIPGALVGVWSPQGSYIRAFGVADKATGEPMDPDLYMRIGSVTKTFTVTAVLQLVDQGKVALDDPIGTYIPAVPIGESITIP